jgi:hypothetical protein
VGGLALDIVVAYLYKSIIRVFEYIESARWKRATALIVESPVLDPFMGCSSVRIRYQVDAEQNFWVTEEEIPFACRRDADRFALKLPPGRKVIVRVHPDYRTHTRFYALGQKLLHDSQD